MKELSIEEKAKAYDHAMKVIEKYKDARIMFTQDLKEEIFPELKGSDDEKIRKAILELVRQSSEVLDKKNQNNMITWLEKQGNLMKALQISNAKIGELIEKNYYLKEQLEKQGEPKQEWSEVDEKMWTQAINEIEAIKSNSSTVFEKNIAQDKIDWLKSLKERYTWKPSDEQMHAFEQVYDWYNNNCAASETLTSLYKDLKKLKG